jgi:hypothetical protein
MGAHRAIGSTALNIQKDDILFTCYPPLKTENLTLAMYELLGESVIVLIGEDEIEPWTSPDLHSLAPARYLRPGVVPWQPKLALLSLCAMIISLCALYTTLFVGPRWAPTLNGFELFKLSAQYQDETHRFETVKFQGCTESLKPIPGMVEMLSGHGSAGGDRLGSIGLSENVADRRKGV